MNIALQQLKDLIIYADRAAFYLRALERGDTFGPGERKEIRCLAHNLQVSVDERIPELIAAERDRAERTDRDGDLS